MLKRIIFVVMITVLAYPYLAITPPVVAQDDTRTRPTEYWIEGMEIWYQMNNRCSAAALKIQLSAFDWPGSHTDVARWLNPYPAAPDTNTYDKSVRLEEMVQFVELQGLKGLVRIGGTPELLETLIAAGFPVLIETAYYDNANFDNWYSHNRVAVGYEAYPREVMYLFDPLRGAGDDGRGIQLPYYEVDLRWRHFNRDFFVIYRPEQEATLQELLGDYWDPAKAAQIALEQALQDQATYGDAFATYNLGAAQLELGLLEEAVANFDLARAMGLPPRFFWYRFEALDAYVAAGRYQDILDIIYGVFNHPTYLTRGIDELYYYAGFAYEGLGDLDRALANFRVAVQRNDHFVEAQAELDRLEGR